MGLTVLYQEPRDGPALHGLLPSHHLACVPVSAAGPNAAEVAGESTRLRGPALAPFGNRRISAQLCAIARARDEQNEVPAHGGLTMQDGGTRADVDGA